MLVSSLVHEDLITGFIFYLAIIYLSIIYLIDIIDGYNNMIFRRLYFRRITKCVTKAGFHWSIVLFGNKSGGIFSREYTELEG